MRRILVLIHFALLILVRGFSASDTEQPDNLRLDGPLVINSLTATPAQICGGGSSQLLVSVSGGSEVYTFSWTSDPPGFTSDLQNPQAEPFVTTTYTVEINDGIQILTASVDITVLPGPTVNPVSNQTICSGSLIGPVIFTGPVPGTTFTWVNNTPSIGLAATGNDFIPLFTVVNITSAPITATIIVTPQANGCVGATRIFTITVNPTPVADAGPDFNNWYGCYATLNGSASGGTLPYIYTWAPDSMLFDSNIANPLTINLYSTTAFSLIVTSQNSGCSSAPDTVYVLVGCCQFRVTPQASPAVICPGSPAILHANAVGGSAIYTYVWSSVPPGFTSMEANPVVSPAVTTTYFVTADDGFNTVAGDVTVSIQGSCITGTISYDNEACTLLSCCKVYLKTNTGLLIDSTEADQNGAYAFSGIPSGSYKLTAQTTRACHGANSVDALLALRHFAGLQPLSGLRLQAADVNLTHYVNSTDALLIQKRFVEMINFFAAGEWIFEEPEFTLEDPSSIVINCKGLCVGDVNGSYVPTLTQADAGPDQLNLQGTTAALAANTPGQGETGAWSIISGLGGNIAGPGNPASVFTGMAGQFYTLVWTLSSTCSASRSDTVVVSFAAGMK